MANSRVHAALATALMLFSLTTTIPLIHHRTAERPIILAQPPLARYDSIFEGEEVQIDEFVPDVHLRSESTGPETLEHAIIPRIQTPVDTFSDISGIALQRDPEMFAFGAVLRNQESSSAEMHSRSPAAGVEVSNRIRVATVRVKKHDRRRKQSSPTGSTRVHTSRGATTDAVDARRGSDISIDPLLVSVDSILTEAISTETSAALEGAAQDLGHQLAASSGKDTTRPRSHEAYPRSHDISEL